MLRPSAASAMGLVDQLVPTHHNLRWAARKAVLQKRRSKGAPGGRELMLKQPVRGMLAKRMRAKTAEKVREDHYPAPFRLIDLFERYGDDPVRMRTAETRFRAADGERDVPQSAPRVHALRDAEGRGAEERLQAQSVHVIGAGAMGGDIAAWCVVCGMQASLQDLDEAQISKALARAKRLFEAAARQAGGGRGGRASDR